MRIGSSNAVLVPWSGKLSAAPELESAKAEDIGDVDVFQLGPQLKEGHAARRIKNLDEA